MTTRIKPALRHLNSGVLDVSVASGIDGACFAQPWDREKFQKVLRQPNVVGRLALYRSCAVGFMVFAYRSRRIELYRLAVLPEAARRGIGSAMMAELRERVADVDKEGIALFVRESNLEAQLFYRSHGFLAVPPVVRGYYGDTGEDGYRMIWSRAARPILTERPPVGPAYHVEGLSPGSAQEGPGWPQGRSDDEGW